MDFIITHGHCRYCPNVINFECLMIDKHCYVFELSNNNNKKRHISGVVILFNKTQCMSYHIESVSPLSLSCRVS